VDEKPWYQKAKLWEACLSSSAAPTFFPPYQFDLFQETSTESAEEYTFVDGAVAANNPSLAALVHALDIEKIDGQRLNIEDISLLSIGTGRTTKPLKFEKVNSWGALNWASHIPEVFMGGQFQITADLCAQLISSINPHGYLRIQFDMNQRYQDGQEDSQKSVRLPKDKQVNVYTGKYLDEALDRADLPHVQHLIETTTAFLNSPKYCKIDGVECSVERAIENFIEANR
jgi:patatin-like phospholipase/acyl hydrolase